jgi:hypothetical protein
MFAAKKLNEIKKFMGSQKMSRRSSRASNKRDQKDAANNRRQNRPDEASGATLADCIAPGDREKLKKLAEDKRDSEQSFVTERRSLLDKKWKTSSAGLSKNKSAKDHRVELQNKKARKQKSNNQKKRSRNQTTSKFNKLAYEEQLRKSHSGKKVTITYSAEKKETQRFKPVTVTSSPKVDEVQALHDIFARMKRWSTADLSMRTIDKGSKKQLLRLLECAENDFHVAGSVKERATIGFDFGTSSTKIVVQRPYSVGGGVGEALVVPEYFRGDKHPHLWVTTIWASPTTGEFSLFEKGGFVEISDIKTQLMNFGRRSVLLKGSFQCGADVVATGYIAFLIRVTVAWVRLEADFNTSVDVTDWSINLGVPAAKLDDKNMQQELNVILAAAWLLAESGETINVTNIKKFHTYKEVDNAAVDLDKFSAAGLGVIPEIVAETAGFVYAKNAGEGLHMMVDIGASTLDACIFNLVPDAGAWSYHIFTADVRLFGTFAQDWVREASNDSKDYTAEDLKKVCEIMLRRILVHTRKKRDRAAEAWQTELPVLWCGGGRGDKFYDQAKAGIEEAMGVISSGRAHFRQISVPNNLEVSCSKEKYHRLGVAWGLSFEKFQIGDFTTPDQTDDQDGPFKNSYEDRFVGAEQT